MHDRKGNGAQNVLEEGMRLLPRASRRQSSFVYRCWSGNPRLWRPLSDGELLRPGSLKQECRRLLIWLGRLIRRLACGPVRNGWATR